MVDIITNAVLNAGKLSSAADVSVCPKKIAALGAIVLSGAWAIGNTGVQSAVGEVSIL